MEIFPNFRGENKKIFETTTYCSYCKQGYELQVFEFLTSAGMSVYQQGYPNLSSGQLLNKHNRTTLGPDMMLREERSGCMKDSKNEQGHLCHI